MLGIIPAYAHLPTKFEPAVAVRADQVYFGFNCIGDHFERDMKTIFIATCGTGIDLSFRAYGFCVFVSPHFHDVLNMLFFFSSCQQLAVS